MKIRIDIDENSREPEIVIRGSSDDVAKLQNAILAASKNAQNLALVRDGRDYYLPAESILFFESVDGKTWAHTAKNIYEIKQKLYELENILPASFVRISKSAIIGTKYILSISHNLAGPSLVRFRGSHKQINVSRGYYKRLVNKLSERSYHESN